MADHALYHIGFNRDDLGANPPTIALLSGNPQRAFQIADQYLDKAQSLSENRGLHSYQGVLPNGHSILSATSGMGTPSLSIVVNELVQVGIKKIIRIGTCGSIQDSVKVGSIVISQRLFEKSGKLSRE